MEQSKEAIAVKFGLCTCDEMYTKRNMTAPDCPWHATCVDEAMEEFATAKIHLLQQEYEHLQRWSQEATLVLEPILDYGQSHPDIKLGSSITTFVIERCKEYDKLKGENEALKIMQQATQENFEETLAEKMALKAKADKMEAMLRDIRKNARLSIRLETEIDDCLPDNSNTNQNENNG